MKKVITVILIPIVCSILCGFTYLQTTHAQALRSTRLDAKLIEAKSRIAGPLLVESTFKAKIRAYGGDIYLPAYREDIVYEPIYTTPIGGSNAVIPGTATIHIDKELPSVQGRYVLKEYEDAVITITLTSKVIPSAMDTSRIVFKTQLNSLIWRPTVQEYNEDEVGNPLLDVSTLEWQTNPVIIIRPQNSSRAAATYKKGGFANALGAFRALIR